MISLLIYIHLTFTQNMNIMYLHFVDELLTILLLILLCFKFFVFFFSGVTGRS